MVCASICFFIPPLRLRLRRLCVNSRRSGGCATYLILRDIFPQNARDLGMIRDPLTFAFFRRKERQLYAISDRIGCMSQGNLDYLLKHNRVDPRKLEILHNWERVPPHREVDVAAVRREYGIEGKFVAVFGGNIGYAQELEFLLELAACYRDRTDIVFLVVGKGAVLPRLVAKAAAEGLTNVIFKEQIPRQRFDDLLATCDVGLINLDRRFTIPNIPSKTLSYFAASLPVLASIDACTDYGRLLDECGAGLWSVTGDLPAYQANFERLLNDPDLRRKFGANGRKALEERFLSRAGLPDYYAPLRVSLLPFAFWSPLSDPARAHFRASRPLISPLTGTDEARGPIEIFTCPVC